MAIVNTVFRRESGLTLIMLLVLKLQSVKSEQKLRQQRECHRAAVDLVETLHAKLPFADMIPANLQNEHVRNALQKMLDTMKDAFGFLDHYASLSTSGKNDC